MSKIDGYYTLGLSWRDKFPNLANNRSLALFCFLSLEKEFKNNPEFNTQYQKTSKEYILTHCCMGRYAVLGDIEQMFHQILVENKNDALCFLWRDTFIDAVKYYCMKVHLFGKVYALCRANWNIKKLQQTNLIPLTRFLSKP